MTKSIEDTMWKSVRGLEESILLLDQAADQLAEAGIPEAADKYRTRSAEALDQSRRIRELIFTHEQLAVDGTPSTELA